MTRRRFSSLAGTEIEVDPRESLPPASEILIAAQRRKERAALVQQLFGKIDELPDVPSDLEQLMAKIDALPDARGELPALPEPAPAKDLPGELVIERDQRGQIHRLAGADGGFDLEIVRDPNGAAARMIFRPIKGK